MKRLTLLLCALYLHATGYAASFTPLPLPLSLVTPGDSSAFSLSKVKVSEAVDMMYAQVMKTPFVITSDVLNDERLVSFRLSAGLDPRQEISRFLMAIGLSVRTVNGVDLITLQKEAKLEKQVFIYHPKFRDGSYLIELVRSIFTDGDFTATRAVRAPAQTVDSSALPEATASSTTRKTPPSGSAASLIDTSTDTLVFNGPASEVKQLAALLEQLDTRQGEVMVRGQVFEVSTGAQQGSAFSLALSLLGGTVTAGVSTVSTLDGFLRFKNTSIDAVFAALSNDSRFKTISTPSLRVRSGATGRFSVGQDVPVLGAVSYPGNSATPVQSVEYRSSGVIFDLSPIVREAVIDLRVQQQISNFVVTQTGVNNSPTLTKRELSTSLSVADGDVVILGGLAEDKESDTRVGFSFLPDWMRSDTGQQSKNEILLVLQVKKL